MASMKAKVLGVGELVDGQEKKWMGCFLDVLRTFGINADQWTTAAQVEWERRRTAEQGAERFMPKGITAYYRFLFWMESTLYVLLRDGVFYFVPTGWILILDLVRIQSINQFKPGRTFYGCGKHDCSPIPVFCFLYPKTQTVTNIK